MIRFVYAMCLVTLTLVVPLGCTKPVDVNDRYYACTTHQDCTPGFVCHAELHVCVDPDEDVSHLLDATADQSSDVAGETTDGTDATSAETTDDTLDTVATDTPADESTPDTLPETTPDGLVEICDTTAEMAEIAGETAEETVLDATEEIAEDTVPEQVEETVTPQCSGDGDCAAPYEGKDACFTDHVCVDGVCQADADSAIDCADDVECTIDSCEAGACIHSPDHASCDDGLTCTSTTCDTSLGCLVTPSSPDPACPDLGVCLGNPVYFCATTDQAACDLAAIEGYAAEDDDSGTCDGLDNDCDGETDEGFGFDGDASCLPVYHDGDLDGFGAELLGCVCPLGSSVDDLGVDESLVGGDFDDTNGTVCPGCEHDCSELLRIDLDEPPALLASHLADEGWVQDSSYFERDVVMTGAVRSLGKLGRGALLLNGDPASASGCVATELSLPEGLVHDVTFEAWIMPEPGGVGTPIIFSYVPTTGEPSLTVKLNDAFSSCRTVMVNIPLASGGTTLATAPTCIDDNLWHHVALRFADEGVALFVDGQEAFLETDLDWVLGEEGSFTLGAGPGCIGNYLDGRVDMVRVSAAALDPSEFWMGVPAECGFVPAGASTASPMCMIPGGSYKVGCAEGFASSCADPETPMTEVYLHGFYMDQHEVPQGAFYTWYTMVGSGYDGTAIPFADDATCTMGLASSPDLPLTCVSVESAVLYCLSMGKDLPTEAEWEGAARGPGVASYPWGDEEPACGFVNFDGCYQDPDEPTLYVVDVDAPADPEDMISPTGLLHAGGNVSEWVLDSFESSAIACPFGGLCANPFRPYLNGDTVVKGGSFALGAEATQVFGRTAAFFTSAPADTGFRCAYHPSSVLVLDDFEDGTSGAWSSVGGTLSVVTGSYGVGHESSSALRIEDAGIIASPKAARDLSLPEGRVQVTLWIRITEGEGPLEIAFEKSVVPLFSLYQDDATSPLEYRWGIESLDSFPVEGTLDYSGGWNKLVIDTDPASGWVEVWLQSGAGDHAGDYLLGQLLHETTALDIDRLTVSVGSSTVINFSALLDDVTITEKTDGFVY